MIMYPTKHVHILSIFIKLDVCKSMHSGLSEILRLLYFLFLSKDNKDVVVLCVYFDND
jgi:hypothetical protein